jgi:flagella basal body P-ring formation protein FlgA
LADESPTFFVLTNAQVDSAGVFLSHLVAAGSPGALPHARLADAPAFGQVAVLPRARVIELVRQAAPDLVPAGATWAGAERVTVTRRARLLAEAELKEQLTTVLQRDFVRDRGELELRFTRPWAPVAIPDEPCVLKVLDLPTAGVTPSFIARFELSTPREVVGAWQVALQAKAWRDVWVARSSLRPGALFAEADVARERRDVLALREAPFAAAQPEATLELAETVSAGQPVCARAVRLRPVVRRGQVVEAQFQDGAMTITLKVEVMENGALGQIVRVRNVQSKRELRGKVRNEQSILVIL